MLLALLHKARTGEGQYVECAQLSSSVFVTSHWYRAGASGGHRSPTSTTTSTAGARTPASTSASRANICVYCTPGEQQAAFRRVVLGDDAAVVDDSGEQLAYELYGREASEWVDALRAAGVPCGEVAERSWLLEYLVDDDVVAAGRATRFDHPEHGPVSAIGRIVQLESYPALEPVRAPILGEHSREILAELGLAADEIAALVAAGPRAHRRLTSSPEAPVGAESAPECDTSDPRRRRSRRHTAGRSPDSTRRGSTADSNSSRLRHPCSGGRPPISGCIHSSPSRPKAWASATHSSGVTTANSR
jgi:hypothetical protein